MSQLDPGNAVGLEAELRQRCAADPESLLVVEVKLVDVELSDAAASADEKNVAVVVAAQLTDKAGSAVAVEPGCVAGSAVSECLVGGPIFAAAAAVKSAAGAGSAAAAELVNEPCSFAVKLVDEAQLGPVVKSLDESCFVAAAVVPVHARCPAFGQPRLGPEAETGLAGEEQAVGRLKCFERCRAHCEDSWRPCEKVGLGFRSTL